MSTAITLFLSGDVMTGCGVDQILMHPGNPILHERWANDARAYLELTEKYSGPIKYPVDFNYIWGEALAQLGRVAPI